MTASAFLLIASQAETLDGERILAECMAKRRLDAKLWGLYANTPHKRDIKPGDTLIIYLAGRGGMRFFATAEAGEVSFKLRNYRGDGDALTDPPVAVLALRNSRIFKESVPIAKIKDRLTFIPKGHQKWGCVLQRGVKRISNSDADLILTEADILAKEILTADCRTL